MGPNANPNPNPNPNQVTYRAVYARGAWNGLRTVSGDIPNPNTNPNPNPIPTPTPTSEWATIEAVERMLEDGLDRGSNRLLTLAPRAAAFMDWWTMD